MKAIVIHSKCPSSLKPYKGEVLRIPFEVQFICFLQDGIVRFYSFHFLLRCEALRIIGGKH